MLRCAAFGNSWHAARRAAVAAQQLPQLKVISANIQPVHMAIIAGADRADRTAGAGGAVQSVRCLSARKASSRPTRRWPPISMPPPATGCARWVSTAWDLFCGVGGFGLHCAQPQTRLTGIEISAEAIACARQSAQRLGLLQ